MTERQFSGFIHGGSVVLAVFIIVAAAAGPEALVINWAPPWVVVLGSLAGLVYTWIDMKRVPEEHTIVTRSCARCDPDRHRGSFS